MIKVRLLVQNLAGDLFETDCHVVMDSQFESNLKELMISLLDEHMMTLRVELPEPYSRGLQRFLIPSSELDVSIERRVPV